MLVHALRNVCQNFNIFSIECYVSIYFQFWKIFKLLINTLAFESLVKLEKKKKKNTKFYTTDVSLCGGFV